MGLIDGLKKQYMLYQIDGWEMCSVTPLGEDTFKQVTMQACTLETHFQEQ